MVKTKHRLPDIGDRHGRLLVTELPEHVNSVWFINCTCDCGERTQVRHQHWVSGHTRSCGCLHADTSTSNLGEFALPKDPHRVGMKVSYQHDMAGTRLYHCWGNMISRCTNPNNNSWGNYGGKGVRVCDEWQTFLGFAEWATSHGYSDDLTIERKDSNGNYEPANCEWITLTENIRRRKMPPRDTRPIIDGRRRCNVCEEMVDVSNFSKDSYDKYGLRKTCRDCQRRYDAVRNLRLAKPPKYNSVAAELNLPAGPRKNSVMLTAFGETKTLSDWAKDSRCVVSYFTLSYRIRALWDHEEALSKAAQ